MNNVRANGKRLPGSDNLLTEPININVQLDIYGEYCFSQLSANVASSTVLTIVQASIVRPSSRALAAQSSI